jgi:hypothetical protein
MTVLPRSLQQRQIALLHATIAKQRMKSSQCASPLGDQQTTGRTAIKPVHQVERWTPGP